MPHRPVIAGAVRRDRPDPADGEPHPTQASEHGPDRAHRIGVHDEGSDVVVTVESHVTDRHGAQV